MSVCWSTPAVASVFHNLHFHFYLFVLFISMSFQLHVQLQLDFSSCFVFLRHSQVSFCAREPRTSAIFDLQPRRNRRRHASHEKREQGKRAEEHTHQPSRTMGRMIGERILESRHDIIARRKGGNECKWKESAARGHLIEFPLSLSHSSICDKNRNSFGCHSAALEVCSCVVPLWPYLLLCSGFFRLIFVKDWS